MKRVSVKVKLLSETAVVPERAHGTDTGYDLTFIGIEKIVGDVIFFKTGLSVEPPEGYYFEVVPRSSISKLPLEMANSVGIIDESYRGEVLVPVRVTHQNMGLDAASKSFPSGIVNIFGLRPTTMTNVANLILNKKPRLFQAILRRRLNCSFEIQSNLDETERSSGGFGSTDIKEPLMPG
jgi:dUTPase